MRRILILIVALTAFSGCGQPSHKPTPPFVCHHKEPAQLGECVRQELEYQTGRKVRATPSLRASRRPQCIDISRYQPHPRFRQLRAEGIVCVIVQGADNSHASNPFFSSQVRGAHEAGMQVGVYIFSEGAPSSSQSSALIAASAGERSRISLGAHVDAEVPSAYPHVCGVVEGLKRSFHIVGVYGSPGTYQGGYCHGAVNWPAEWSISLASPLPGWPFSTIKFRQWCGTCHLGGNDGEIDRDEDLGLIALSHPCDRKCQLHHELAKARKEALVYAKLRRRHNCASKPLDPKPRESYRRLCYRWNAAYSHRKDTIHRIVKELK